MAIQKISQNDSTKVIPTDRSGDSKTGKDGKNLDSGEKEKKVESNLDSSKNNKKSGPIKKTIQELKLVSWPSFKYVLFWSTTIIVFTLTFGAFLGFTDHYLASGMRFVGCTADLDQSSESFNGCLQRLTTDLTFRDFLNRDFTPVEGSQSQGLEISEPNQTEIQDNNVEIQEQSEGDSQNNPEEETNSNPENSQTPSTDNQEVPSQTFEAEPENSNP